MSHLFLELYSGSATMADTFSEIGYDICTVDKRKRTGKCVPVFHCDILKISTWSLISRLIELYGALPCVVWVGLPCPRYSYAAGNKYYSEGRLKNEYYLESTKHLHKAQTIIAEINPALWFIENPRGHLRHHPDMINWLIKYGGMTKQIMYSSYGAPYPKPTDIFTNALSWQPRPMGFWGKGAKYAGVLNNLTVHQKQMYPQALCLEIASFCKNYLELRNSAALASA